MLVAVERRHRLEVTGDPFCGMIGRPTNSAIPSPGLDSLLTFGSELFRRDPVDVAVDLRERYGHVVRIPPLYPGIERSVYLVTHPNDVRYILQSHPNRFNGLDIPGSDDFSAAVEGSILGSPDVGGTDWWIRRLRRIAPEFSEHYAKRRLRKLVRETETALSEYGSAPESEVSTRVGRSRPKDPAAVVDSGDGLRLRPLTARLSVRLLGASLFDSDIRVHEVAIIRSVARLRRAFKRRTFAVVAGPLARRLPDEIGRTVKALRRPFDPKWLDRSREPLDDLRAVADTMVTRRERFPGAFDDAITTWLTRPDTVTGETLSPADVASEVAGLLIAGFATVSAGLTWALVLLATNADVQKRVAEEGRQSRPLGSSTDPDGIGYNDVLSDLSVTHRVWQETLRLYPTLPVFGRTTRRAISLSGYTIPADASVLVSPYVTHRDPTFWTVPEEFDPNRFRPGRRRDRHEFAYYPFSSGPHGCLGRQIATVEAVVALATLCREYRVTLVDDTAAIGLDSAINLVPDADVRGRFVRRET